MYTALADFLFKGNVLADYFFLFFSKNVYSQQIVLVRERLIRLTKSCMKHLIFYPRFKAMIALYLIDFTRILTITYYKVDNGFSWPLVGHVTPIFGPGYLSL